MKELIGKPLDAQWVAHDSTEYVCLNGGDITFKTDKALLYSQEGVYFEKDCWIPISQIKYFKPEEISGALAVELNSRKTIDDYFMGMVKGKIWMPIEKMYIPRWVAQEKFGKETINNLGYRKLFKKIEIEEEFFEDLI